MQSFDIESLIARDVKKEPTQRVQPIPTNSYERGILQRNFISEPLTTNGNFDASTTESRVNSDFRATLPMIPDHKNMCSSSSAPGEINFTLFLNKRVISCNY